MCAWRVQAERGSGAVTGLWSLSFWERSKQSRHLGPRQVLSWASVLADASWLKQWPPAVLSLDLNNHMEPVPDKITLTPKQPKVCFIGVSKPKENVCATHKVPNINILFSWLIREIVDAFPITAVSLLYLALSIKWAIEMANWVLLLTGFHPERADFLQPFPKLPCALSAPFILEHPYHPCLLLC